MQRWTEDQLASTVAGVVEELLADGGRHQIEELVDREAVKLIVVRALGAVPASAAVGGLVELATSVLHDGPGASFPSGSSSTATGSRPCSTAGWSCTPSSSGSMEGLADVPLVGTTASRFMGRVVGEVMQANKAVAEKVPGWAR